MNSINLHSREMQNVSLFAASDVAKDLNEKNVFLQAIHGTGISHWEAEVLVDLIEVVYFAELNLKKGKKL